LPVIAPEYCSLSPIKMNNNLVALMMVKDEERREVGGEESKSVFASGDTILQ